jgi:hypothetical protein
MSLSAKNKGKKDIEGVNYPLGARGKTKRNTNGQFRERIKSKCS